MVVLGASGAGKEGNKVSIFHSGSCESNVKRPGFWSGWRRFAGIIGMKRRGMQITLGFRRQYSP